MSATCIVSTTTLEPRAAAELCSAVVPAKFLASQLWSSPRRSSPLPRTHPPSRPLWSPLSVHLHLRPPPCPCTYLLPLSPCLSPCILYSSSGESQIADTDMKEVYLSSVDLEGRVWASVVVGEKPGFVEVSQSPSDQE